MKRLEIGTTGGRPLTLPATETTTNTIAIFGGRGMGKTNLGSVLCEELAETGQRFCYLDPMGVAWGMRHSADGAGVGLDILILGGRHGDLPIEPTGGAVVADFIANARENVLLDISASADGRRWSQGQKIRFVADYLERLLEVQGEHRRPLMQIIDEAARFAPQTIEFKGGKLEDNPVARCKVALEVLVEEGRNAAVGVTLLTQRSARIAKSVTELAELMIAFRIIGPNSTEAVLDWFGAHVQKAKHNELLEQLRKLPRGNALVVSPGWLDLEGVAQIRLRHTFDSSKTPTGTETKLAKRVKPRDLEKLRETIAATVEKAEAADPKKIRETFRQKLQAAETAAREANARIGVLEAKLAKEQATPRRSVLGQARDVRLKAKDREDLERIAKRIETATKDLQSAAPPVLEKFRLIFDKASKEIGAAVARPDFQKLLQTVLSPPVTIAQQTGTTWRPATAADAPPRAAAPPPKPPAPPRTDLAELGADHRIFSTRGDLKKPVRAMLTALAQHPGGLNREQILILSGYVPSGDTAVGMAGMLEHGLIQEQGRRFTITPRGLQILGPFEALPTGAELRAHLVEGNKLSSAERKLLGALFTHYPNRLTRAQIVEAANLKPSGDTSVGIAKFLKLGWADEGDGGIAAAETFFQ